LGAETLGAQAFLQAFVVAHFPIAYIGTVDGLFCLVLCLALAAFGLSPGRWGVGATAAAICAWLIDPQLVNISAVFSGAALIAAAVLMSARVAVLENTFRSGLLLGLVYAGLIALKTTFAVFVGVHLLSLLAAGWWFGDRRWTAVLWAAGGTVVCLAPWLLLHLPLYLTPVPPPAIMPSRAAEGLALFSRQLSGYGVAQLPYTLLATAVLFAAFFFVIASRRGWVSHPSPLAAICAAGFATGLTYFVVLVVGSPLLFGRVASTRYVCPVFIGALPAMMRLVESRDPKRPLMIWLGLAGFAVAVGVLFWPSTVERPRQWWRDRTPLAFFALAEPAARHDYIAYNRHVLDGYARANLELIQGFVPAGEPLGAWVSTPFLLDFRRNPVLHADPAGLSMRWARWPTGVRYFLLEYRGFAIRSDADYREMWDSPGRAEQLVAVRALAFLDELHRQAASAKIVYNDGAYLLMRTEAP
jgi:hypothetical protein